MKNTHKRTYNRLLYSFLSPGPPWVISSMLLTWECIVLAYRFHWTGKSGNLDSNLVLPGHKDTPHDRSQIVALEHKTQKRLGTVACIFFLISELLPPSCADTGSTGSAPLWNISKAHPCPRDGKPLFPVLCTFVHADRALWHGLSSVRKHYQVLHSDFSKAQFAKVK